MVIINKNVFFGEFYFIILCICCIDGINACVIIIIDGIVFVICRLIFKGKR